MGIKQNENKPMETTTKTVYCYKLLPQLSQELQKWRGRNFSGHLSWKALPKKILSKENVGPKSILSKYLRYLTWNCTDNLSVGYICTSTVKILNLYFILYMYLLVSLLSIIYPFPVMHSLLVTVICYKISFYQSVHITYLKIYPDVRMGLMQG